MCNRSDSLYRIGKALETAPSSSAAIDRLYKRGLQRVLMKHHGLPALSSSATAGPTKSIATAPNATTHMGYRHSDFSPLSFGIGSKRPHSRRLSVIGGVGAQSAVRQRLHQLLLYPVDSVLRSASGQWRLLGGTVAQHLASIGVLPGRVRMAGSPRAHYACRRLFRLRLSPRARRPQRLF